MRLFFYLLIALGFAKTPVYLNHAKAETLQQQAMLWADGKAPNQQGIATNSAPILADTPPPAITETEEDPPVEGVGVCTAHLPAQVYASGLVLPVSALVIKKVKLFILYSAIKVDC
ncbi:MAG TPA: hypothetical protein PK239_08055 [Chitinophagales bacterium]|nr:hypothetical protein [Chitinophagales bacterium]